MYELSFIALLVLPADFSSPYVLNTVTIDVPQPVCDKPDPAALMDVELTTSTQMTE